MLNSSNHNTTASVSVMHLDPEHLRISVQSTNNSAADSHGITCFAELSCHKIFLEHRIESAAQNAIVFEIDLIMLKSALHSILLTSSNSNNSNHLNINHSSSLHNSSVSSSVSSSTHHGHNSHTHISSVGAAAAGRSTGIVMKLAKKNGLPCLCLDAQQQQRHGQIYKMDQTHALPIRIMRATEMQYHLPPQVSMPDVQLELPVDGRVPIRTVLERLKSISAQVYLDGNMSGELTLRVENDGVSIRTFYNKLIPRFEDCKASEESSLVEEAEGPLAVAATSVPTCTLKVDSKKLCNCFQWQSSMGIGRAVSSAVLCMVENEMLILHVLLNPDDLGFFTYYIPVHFLSADQLEY